MNGNSYRHIKHSFMEHLRRKNIQLRHLVIRQDPLSWRTNLHQFYERSNKPARFPLFSGDTTHA